MRPSSPLSLTSSNRSTPEVEDTMQVFVKSVTGETIPLTVPQDASVSTLKSLLSLRTSLPASELRLVFAGKHLSDSSSTLSDYSISRESTLHVAVPLRGGKPPKVYCNYKNCKSLAPRIVGDCGFCNGHFCTTHRMLESHDCSGLEDCKKQSHEQNANKLNSERTMAIKGI
ncbi:ubiquitin-like protein [Xylona heveae TC161]|uniref:Ubiquitin-like protein n=1 Tax=Xylona heveae (strain CBS 132557 / TC161) TaxID=1328760 RepID=A0A165HIF4_XYLHT|nr:ubiquitin-like protein [Xylona heveae TC161]KZF23566.1 ubiquitin-like protein [Xylona heveae TC161]